VRAEPELDEVERNRMPLIEHLRELRKRVVIAASAIFLGAIGGLFVATDVYDFLRAPIMAVFHEQPRTRMDVFYLWISGPVRALVPSPHIQGSLNVGNSPLEGMYSFFQIGLITGLVAAGPVVAWQIWRFVAPALYSNEKRWMFPLALSSSALFVSGALFCYAVIFPVSFPFFLTTLEASAVISVQGYLEAVVRMLIGFGLCFQLPVVTWFLARIGLIDHRDLIKGFRYAVVGIFVVAAIVTPTPDVLTQTLLALPLIVLYVLGIGVAWLWSTKRR
jgi:sec-independent protein translocase protein TatC